VGAGAAVASGVHEPRRKTLCLAGDGGFMLNIGELATAAQERADMVILLMNDRGYGVIKNIQDAHYGGRRHYVDLLTPDFGKLADSVGVAHQKVTDLAEFPGVLERALAGTGPQLLEIDMPSIGKFAAAFAGPPTRQ